MKKEFEIKVKGNSVSIFYGSPVFGFLSCGDEYEVAVFNKKLMNESEKEIARKVKKIMDNHCTKLNKGEK